MPSPLGTALAAWEKTFLRYAVSPLYGFLYDLLSSEGGVPDTSQWRRLFLHMHDTQTGAPPADDMWITWDLVKFTGGNIQNSWSTTDYTTAETAFNTWYGNLISNLPTIVTASEYKWYIRSFNPPDNAKPFAKNGPPVRVTAKATPGTGASSFLARQTAMSVTEKTTWPGHWGRFYVPVLAAAGLTSGGRFSTALVDAMCSATQTLYNSLATANLNVVVPVTQVDKVPFRGLLGVTQIQVDDVPDVIRRRRLRNPGYRKILP